MSSLLIVFTKPFSSWQVRAFKCSLGSVAATCSLGAGASTGLGGPVRNLSNEVYAHSNEFLSLEQFLWQIFSHSVETKFVTIHICKRCESAQESFPVKCCYMNPLQEGENPSHCELQCLMKALYKLFIQKKTYLVEFWTSKCLYLT